MTDQFTYALEITGDSMLPVHMLPVYLQGDTIIVSPAAKVRTGDRVVVHTKDGQVMARILQRKSAKQIELAAFDTHLAVQSIEAKNFDCVARII